MLATIKQTIKGDPRLLRLYVRSRFIARLPTRDLFHPGKLKLFLTVEPYTMLPYSRMSALYEAAKEIEASGICGSIVECGVWNGGSAGIMAAVAGRNNTRRIWLLDSWEGLPEPGEDDIHCSGSPGEKGMALGFREKTEEVIFGKLGLDRSRVHLLEGWFNETLPANKTDMGDISLLHLDGDWYESVKLCLNELYDSVVDGGYIFIDDYGEWKGCKKAVDEFFEERNITVKLRHIDYAGVYFRK